ncbi:MAG: hypothetical protein J6N18_01435 [Kiritimatiellae bacterium]|nr:hypothetical protein [Kiritimatiellia bacterium]
MNKTKRLVSAEQMAFLNLQAAVRVIGKQEDALGNRLAMVPGGKRYLHTGTGMLNRLIKEIEGTMPPEQLEHLNRQKAYTRFIISTKAVIPRCPDKEFGRWLSFKELDVVASAIRECCRTCTLDNPQDQKQCPYCKLLEVLPTDKSDENAPGCGYFSIWAKY